MPPEPYLKWKVDSLVANGENCQRLGSIESTKESYCCSYQSTEDLGFETETIGV